MSRVKLVIERELRCPLRCLFPVVGRVKLVVAAVNGRPRVLAAAGGLHLGTGLWWVDCNRLGRWLSVRPVMRAWWWGGPLLPR